MSPVSTARRQSPPSPPPPGPPAVGRFTDRDDLAAPSPRSSRSSFVLDADPPEPQSGVGQLTPEIWDEMRKFIAAGGYEGMKRRIVEEVGEQLKSGDDSDGESTTSSISPPPPPTGFSQPPPAPRKPASPRSGTPRHGSFPRPPPPPPFYEPQKPSGMSFPHTPPASPRHGPQGGRPRAEIPPINSPSSPPAHARQSGAKSPELSPVDRCWGELFDEDGKATKRLGQVLRGLASYLMSQSPPETVVIPPSKLAAFYAQFSVNNEPHPYSEIFTCRDGDKEDYRDIAHLYEDLECEYHLVKHHPSSRTRPLVPALTPSGFVQWTIMSIYAYPDEEAARLDAVMSRLPIDAACAGAQRLERLPKQLSRHLLPARPDRTARRDLDAAVGDVAYERGAREKKGRRASPSGSGSGSGAARTASSRPRSESEPISRDRRGSSQYARSNPPPQQQQRDEEASDHQQQRKRPAAKSVSFGRAPSMGSAERDGTSPPARSRRASSERAGRPYSFLGGAKVMVPAATSSSQRGGAQQSKRDAEPGSPLSEPAGSSFELSNGQDRDRDREGYKYSRDAVPRRVSSRGEEEPTRSGSGRRRRRRSEVVVEQDRSPNWMQILREVSSIYH